MPSRLTNPEGRNELISLFDQRIHTPSAYIDVPNKEDLLDTVVNKFQMRISDSRVGHGAMVLLQTKGFRFEAFPFALDPSIAENPDPGDFVHGFHKYVTREAYAEIDRTMTYSGFTMSMWHSDDDRIVAMVGEGPTFFNANELEAIRQLSLDTPDVAFLTSPMNDKATRIKIMGGSVIARANDSNGEWVPRSME